MTVNHVIFMLCCSWLSVTSENSNRCSTDKPCAADEFFDSIVCLCSSCADLCRLRPDRSTDSSCQLYCPDYYKLTTLPRPGSIVKEFVSSSTSVAVLPVHEDNALVKKPLFWTSVVSVFISVVATIVLIVLCTCKKSRSALALHRTRRLQRPCLTRLPANEASEKDESSTGMLKAGDEGNDQLLSSSMKHVTKDKCGETFAPYVSSYPMSMNSCDGLCETDISHCESSFCLHKPCVAPFRDPGFLADREKLYMDDRCRTIANADTNESTNASTNANTNAGTTARTTASTTASTGLISRAAKDTVICTDMSARTTNSGRSESLDSSLYVQSLEKPSEAMEICDMESGYFNSSSCVGASTGCEESLVSCNLYTIPVASGVATKEVELPSTGTYPVQETRNCTEDGNNAADRKYYTENFSASIYGFESKASNNRRSLGLGVKPSLLMSLHRLLDSAHEESALQESSEETGLKKTQPVEYCILNCMPGYISSASHNGSSCEIYVHAKDGSIQELEKLIDGKQLAELNLKIRSNADAPKARSEPCFFNLELRNSTRHEVVDINDEDTAVKNWKRNTYP